MYIIIYSSLSYAGAFVYFPGAFYGVGYNAGAEGYAQELTTTMGIFRISYCTALAGRLYRRQRGHRLHRGEVQRHGHGRLYERHQGRRRGRETGSGRQDGRTLHPLAAGRYDPAKQDPFSNYITESGDNPDASTPASASSPNTTRAT